MLRLRYRKPASVSIHYLVLFITYSIDWPYLGRMRKPAALFFGILALATLAMRLPLAAHPALTGAPSHVNQTVTPYRETQQGVIKPLQAIESGVVPQMKRQGASYIGAEYNAQSLHYRLKFMNDGSVIWVDVDGRSGAIIAQSGH